MLGTHLRYLALIGDLAVAGPALSAGAGKLPELYFYSPPYQLSDGSVISSPLAISAAQMTTAFPAIEEMTGVVLELTWAQLCPQRGQCDFSIIDDTLRYWGPRGKKVVLGVSNAGPPMKAIQGGQPQMVGETPDWVLNAVATYDGPTHQIGRVGTQDVVTIIYPQYWDPRFAPLWIDFVRELGRRYDGNKTLSYVRISTGLVGEDTATPFGPHPEKAAGYSYAKWLGYSHQMLDAYAAAFPHSTLEFDISWLPWGYTLGDARDKAATDAFMGELNRRRVFVAFNGLQPDAHTWLQHAEQPGFALNRVMHYLAERQRQGLGFGLEAVGPMMVPKMQDIGAIGAIFHNLPPQRIVFFGLDASGIDFVRHGPKATNDTAVQWMQGRPQSLAELGNLSQQLIDAARR